MKKTSTLLLSFIILGIGSYAQRYVNEIFTNVNVVSDVEYSQNITIINGSPQLDTLHCDIYTPQGDTAAERPVILIAHGGTFLPVPLNGQATGYKDDSSVVELCTQFAKRGYTAVAYTYRLGWNAVGNQDDRTGTYLNAVYRGIQDTWTLVRYMRSTYSNGNLHTIDTSRIILGGVEHGGYLSIGTATLDKYSEIELAKFLHSGTGNSYVDTALSGDIYGEWARPLNLANHVGESNKIHFAFNLGGEILDSTWLESGDVPMVSFHCPFDPFGPFGFGALIVPITGDFVMNLSGSQDIQRRSNRLGNNSPFQNTTFNDPFTMEANTKNRNYDGLFPFFRPFPPPEASPWNWWDTIVWNVPHPSGGTFNDAGRITNPDMSAQKARTYIDTVQGYLQPRIVQALNLVDTSFSHLGNESRLNESIVLYPSISQNSFRVFSRNRENSILQIQIIDQKGRLAKNILTNTVAYQINHEELSNGFYMVRIRTQNGITLKKVVLE